jgi:hypothetical protein
MSRSRRLLALALLALLAASAGCNVLGPGPVDRDALSEDATYDWNRSVDASIDVSTNSYTAVYNVSAKSTGDEGTIELYQRDTLGTDIPLEVSALQFRFENGTRVRYEDGQQILVYPNGTTKSTDTLGLEKTRQRTIVTLPADEGKLAYTVDKVGKQVSTPTFVEGSYEMRLPENARVGVPLLAQVQPTQATTTLEDGRVLLTWDDVTRSPVVLVRWYLERDLLIFSAILLIGIGLALVGGTYYWLQIKETVRTREDVGLDVDTGDDDRRRPPPGMR